MAYLDDIYAVLQVAPTGVPTYVRLSQNENGRRMIFSVAGGEIPSGSTATISGTKPDGVVYSAACTISGSTVTVNETVQLTAAAGEWDAKIRITNGGNVIATGRVRFVIDADTVDPGAVPSDSELEGIVAEAAGWAEDAKSAAYGSPLKAATVAEMTDKTRVYVYTGSESGYTAGNWYYWNGSTWASGGVYNSTAVQTDKTLSIPGMAADAEATGDKIDDLTSDVNYKYAKLSEPTDNLFDKREIVIGIQASGSATGRKRALSGAMKTDGAGVVKAFNLPSNIKYEIEYYSGEDAGTYQKNSGGWITDTKIVRATENYPYIRILFGTVDDSEFTENDFDDLRMQVTAGSVITGYKDHITALDFVARKAGESLEYNNNVNLFDTESVVIGVNAKGLITSAPRALSGAMKVDGTALIKAYNLPGNLKYEIEYYSDEDASTYLGFATGWVTDTDERIYSQDGAYVRILFASVDNTTISQDDINNVKILVMKDAKLDKEYFKVCTWNVGLWYKGSPHGMDMELLYKWYRVIGGMDADIILTQESPLNIDSDGTMKYGDLMGFKYPYLYLPVTSDNQYYAKGIASKIPFYGVTKNVFSASARTYLKGYMHLNGKKICILSSHLSLDDRRDEEVEELLAIMNAEEYVILCADFNFPTVEGFDVFTNAGYKIANHGRFGDFETCPLDRENKILDNCVTSSNIEIEYAEANEDTGKDGISDHLAFVATIRID